MRMSQAGRLVTSAAAVDGKRGSRSATGTDPRWGELLAVIDGER